MQEQKFQTVQYSRDWRIDPYGNPEPEVVMGWIVATLVTTAIYAFVMWRLPSKAGYRGIARWLWFWGLALPPITPFALIAFLVIPYPVQRECRALKRAAKNSGQGSVIDLELQKLKRQQR